MNSTESLVLDEDQAIELLAFLITAARIQLGEPASYGTMRLLTAAERLSSFMEARASPATQAFLGRFKAEMAGAQELTLGTDRYTAAMDSLCRGIAEQLVSRSGLKDDAK